MGELSSKLFTQGDAAAVQQLDNCALGKPSEVQTHFLEGGKGFQRQGEAVRKLQQALQNALDADITLKALVRPFTINGVYDKEFGDAIEDFKKQKGILNFANKVDRIVGIKTVRELDKDPANRGVPQGPTPGGPAPRPTERPRALPNCVPQSSLPFA